MILERDEQEILTTRAKQCEHCGYFHPIPGQDDGPDLCENCGAALGTQLRQLFRLQNVSTVRRDRINSDEEERQRLGYEIRSLGETATSPPEMPHCGAAARSSQPSPTATRRHSGG